jgi:hypothetical protein
MNENNEYYWSLVLESGWVQAGIWTISDKKAEVVCYSNSLAWGDSDEDLLASVDKALSNAIDKFPEELTEPNKTVFGVPPSWVGEGTIKKEYLDRIRKICSKLSLTPSGFVVLSEAIAHEVKIDEGSPLSGIIIGVAKGKLDVTLFRLGNLIGSVNVGRSVHLIDDVVEALSRFAGGEHFPSRMILYNGEARELEDFRQELMKAEWGNYPTIKFLHSPQIEIVDNNRRITAVSLAGASEIGEIDGVKKNEAKTEKTNIEQGNVNKAEGLNASDVGFVIGQDVQKIEADDKNENDDEQEFIVRGEGINEKKNPLSKVLGKLKLPKIKLTNPMNKLKNKRGSASLPSAKLPRSPKRFIYLGIAVFIIILFGLGAVWWYVPKATVILYVSPKTIEESTYVTLDESATESDMENLIIPAETQTVEVSGSKTLAASGTKLVGDRAKGKVTIRNGTSSGIKLGTDTDLVGPNSLKFNLEEEASVSAATSPSSPGNLEANIVAADIGAEYNLAKGESLTVGNYPKSEVDAVIEDDLSGGSSRQVTAVSESDLKKLSDGLTSELKQQALDKLNEQAGTSDVFVDGAVRTEVLDKSYNHSAGDEADEVTLDMNVQAVGLIIAHDVVTKIGRQIFNGQVPDGFNLKDENIQANFDLIGEKDGVWDFKVTFKANLLPEVNPDEVTGKISGKYPTQAQEYLSTISGFKRAEITIKPRFPSKLAIIPRVKNHISVEVVSDK